jgi:hypothetical protein
MVKGETYLVPRMAGVAVNAHGHRWPVKFWFGSHSQKLREFAFEPGCAILTGLPSSQPTRCCWGAMSDLFLDTMAGSAGVAFSTAALFPLVRGVNMCGVRRIPVFVGGGGGGGPAVECCRGPKSPVHPLLCLAFLISRFPFRENRAEQWPHGLLGKQK